MVCGSWRCLQSRASHHLESTRGLLFGTLEFRESPPADILVKRRKRLHQRGYTARYDRSAKLCLGYFHSDEYRHCGCLHLYSGRRFLSFACRSGSHGNSHQLSCGSKLATHNQCHSFKHAISVTILVRKAKRTSLGIPIAVNATLRIRSQRLFLPRGRFGLESIRAKCTHFSSLYRNI